MTEYIFRTEKKNFDERVVPYLEEISEGEPIVNGNKKNYFLPNNQVIETEPGEDLLVRIILNNPTQNILREMGVLAEKNDN